MGTDRQRWELTIEDTRDEESFKLRLRAALKRLLRAFGFRVVAVKEVQPKSEE